MVGFKVNTKEFEKAFNEYMKYTKRSVTEAINQHAYYAARDAVLLTKAAPKETIRSELEAPSRDYPDVPLAAILVNQRLKSKGQSGLSGKAMAAEVQRFIKKRENSRNFLKAGWIPAVKVLERLVPRKGGAKISGVKPKGQPKGGAKGAGKMVGTIVASIWNEVSGGKKANPRVTKLIEEGAAAALKMETESMLKYISRKLDEANQKYMS